MEPTLAANSHWLPIIYSQEWGVHWDSIGNYALFLFFLGGHVKGLIDRVFDVLKALVNKIHFSFKLPIIGTVYVDFSKYTWDDDFFDYVRDKMKMKVAAKESEARKIKLKYKTQFEDPKNSDAETQAKLLDEYHEEINGLTKTTIGEMKTFYPDIWRAAVARFKDEALAENWLEQHVKAEVVERKNGSTPAISMTETITTINNGENHA
jgi:hypothetical protein